ncbi:MAG TPA: hypothetical protein VFC84_01760 [Desulfosporosinus sp.]|nr:hypothetical protein [Desulfosporosinus sp.]
MSILAGIVPLVFLVLLVLIIASVVSVKKGRGESLERGNEMIKTVYVYLILFATLMMTIGGTVAAFMAVADIVAPPANYQTFNDYNPQSQYKGEFGPNSPVPPAQTLSDAELKLRYDQMIIDEKSNTKQRAVNSLIKSFGWIIIPLPIFLFFQRRMNKQPV